MSDNNNQFQPYRYSGAQSPQQQPTSPRAPGSLNLAAAQANYDERNGGLFGVLKRPAVATAALLFGAALLASVAFFGGSDTTDNDLQVPIIKADATPVREAPVSPQGMQIQYGDNSIFAAPNLAQAPEQAPVENLLENVPSGLVISDSTASNATNEVVAALSPAPTAVTPVPTPSITEVPVKTQKTETEAPTPATQKLYKPGDAPETLAFVQSVLKEKDSKTAAPKVVAKAETPKASQLAGIKPAAGAATARTATAIKPGSYYVQLASVQSQSGAHGSWGKLKKTYSSLLSKADYRVKQADLGAKGTYYRIQAGPMSKADADRICGSIKAQKPGGCLVTK